MTHDSTSTDDETDEPTDSFTDDEAEEPTAIDTRRTVRDRYASIASTEPGGCCGPSTGDAGGADSASTSINTTGPSERDLERRSERLGYDPVDTESAPRGSNLGLGCGNPVAIANLETGETVLDLGSGAGFDCFLAAREVGPGGRAIGVDMTPEMVDRARANAEESDLGNLDFRLGEIEHLPVGDETVDVVISNCVINLSPAKSKVYAEAARALRPGGRLSVSDIVATEPLPEDLRADEDLLAGCIGGAATVEDHRRWIERAGFTDVEVVVEGEWNAEHDGQSLPVVSARIEASVPG